MLTTLRLAWRQQRWEIAFLLGGSVLLALAMVVVAWQLDVNGEVVAACHQQLDATLSEACRSSIQFGNLLGSAVALFVTVAIVAPFAVGVFLGAPLVAREIEHRTAPMAWSLTISRRGWLAGRVLPPLVVIVLVLLLLGQASELLLTSVQDDALGFMHFGQHGPILAARGLAVFAIGVAVGLAAGRVLPAVLVTGLAALALVALLSLGRDQLMRAEAEWFPANFESDVFAMIYDSRLRDDATGEILTHEEVFGTVPPEDIDPETGVPSGMTQLYLAVDPARYPSFVAREIGALGSFTVVVLGFVWAVIPARRPE